MRKLLHTIKSWFGNARFYFIVAFLFLLFAAFCFTWRIWGALSIQLPINPEIWGQFGDFVGGILGTVFSLISVMLVVWTFNTQNKTAETQRFNDLFFELIHLYQTEVKELNGELERIIDIKKDEDKDDSIQIKKERIQYNDKDFFDEEKRIIQKNYRNLKSYENNVSRAISYYMLFYTENRSKMAAYFRTLYRIFELIDKSSLINEQRKKEYAKIVRAQLTESELFFLRYNATTIYGTPFVLYLNKYHILKHLPAFELLEFKDWWNEMNRIERESINIVYFTICNALKEMFKKSNANKTIKADLFPNANTKYHIFLSLINHCDFSINVNINRTISNKFNEFIGLDKLDDKRIQQLMDCFTKEIFMYSNFNQFNKTNEIKTYSNPIITKGSIVEINSGIKNIMNNPLVIKYPNLCPSTK